MKGVIAFNKIHTNPSLFISRKVLFIDQLKKVTQIKFSKITITNRICTRPQILSFSKPPSSPFFCKKESDNSFKYISVFSYLGGNRCKQKHHD